MDNLRSISKIGKDLLDLFDEFGTVTTIPKGAELLKTGDYIRQIPILLDGVVKVYTQQEDKEMLLYYLKSSESCVATYMSVLQNTPSKIIAITETESKILLLPVEKIRKWVYEFPRLNIWFLEQYNMRYFDLLDNLGHLLFSKLDDKIYAYLKERQSITLQNPIAITHREIANDLGTVREVISRAIKKMEREGRIEPSKNGLKIL